MAGVLQHLIKLLVNKVLGLLVAGVLLHLIKLLVNKVLGSTGGWCTSTPDKTIG